MSKPMPETTQQPTPPGAPQWSREQKLTDRAVGHSADFSGVEHAIGTIGKAVGAVGRGAQKLGMGAKDFYTHHIMAVESGGIVDGERAGGPAHAPETANGITELTVGSSEADAPTLYILSDVSDLCDPENPRKVKQVKLGPPPDNKERPIEAMPVLAKRVELGKDKQGKDLWNFERIPIDAGGKFVFPKSKNPKVSYGIAFYTADGQPHFVAAQNLSLTPPEQAQPAVESQGVTSASDLTTSASPSQLDVKPPAPPPVTPQTARQNLADRIILSGVNTNERRVFDVVEDIMVETKSFWKKTFAEFHREKLAKHVEKLQDAILSPFSRESILEARKLAETKYQDHLSELKGQSKLKYWQTRIGEALKDRFSTGETMVEKFTLTELENQQNTALQAVITNERAAFRADQTAVTERFDAAAQVTGERINNFIRRGMGEDLKHLPNDHELSIEMKKIIRERLTGRLNDDDFDTRLKNLSTLARDKYPAELRGIKYFDSTVREVVAKYEAEFHGRLEHEDGLSDLDAKLAQTQVALGIGQMGEATQFTPTETRAWVKKMENWADWVKNKTGWNLPGLINPYTAGTAVSAVIALSQIPKTIISMKARAATVLVGGAGGAVVSGAFAAFEENKRLNREYFNFLGKREAGQRGGKSKEWKLHEKFAMNEVTFENLAHGMTISLINEARSGFKDQLSNDEFASAYTFLIDTKSRLRVSGRSTADGKLRVGLIDLGPVGQMETNRTRLLDTTDQVENHLRQYAATHRSELNVVLGSSDDFDTFLNKCVNMQVEVLDKGRGVLTDLNSGSVMRLALDPLSGYNPEIEVIRRNWRGVWQKVRASGIDAIFEEAKRDFRGRAIKKGAATGTRGFVIGLGVSEVLTSGGSVINDVILHKGTFHGGPILGWIINNHTASTAQAVSPDLDVTSAQNQVMVRLTNGETVSVLSANDIRLNDAYELSRSTLGGLHERAAAHGLSLAQGTEILTVADATGPAHQIFTDSTGHVVMGPPQLHWENADGMHRLVLEVQNQAGVAKEVQYYETPIGTPVNDEGVMRALSNHPLLQFHNDLAHTPTTIPGEVVPTPTEAASGGLVEIQVADFGPSHGAKGISELAAKQMFNPQLDIDNPNGATNVLTKLGKHLLQEQGLNPYNLQTEDVVKLPAGFFEAGKLGNLVDEAVKMHKLNPEVFNNLPANDLHKIVWDSVAGGDLDAKEASLLLEHLGGGAAATTTVTQALPQVVSSTTGGLYIDVNPDGEIINNILAVTQAAPETARNGVVGAIGNAINNAVEGLTNGAGTAAPFIFPIPIVQPGTAFYEPGVGRGTDHRAEPPPPTDEPRPIPGVKLGGQPLTESEQEQLQRAQEIFARHPEASRTGRRIVREGEPKMASEPFGAYLNTAVLEHNLTEYQGLAPKLLAAQESGDVDKQVEILKQVHQIATDKQSQHVKQPPHRELLEQKQQLQAEETTLRQREAADEITDEVFEQKLTELKNKLAGVDEQLGIFRRERDLYLTASRIKKRAEEALHELGESVSTQTSAPTPPPVIPLSPQSLSSPQSAPELATNHDDLPLQTLEVNVPREPKKPVVGVTTAVSREKANKPGIIKFGNVEISGQTHYGEAVNIAEYLHNEAAGMDSGYRNRVIDVLDDHMKKSASLDALRTGFEKIQSEATLLKDKYANNALSDATAQAQVDHANTLSKFAMNGLKKLREAKAQHFKS